MVEEKNSDSESKEEQPKNKRRFAPELLKKGLQCDLDQYDRLIECSEKGPEGIEEWNKRREENPDEEIWLQGVDLWGRNLEKANLNGANLENSDLSIVSLQGAELSEANLQGANLFRAELRFAELSRANLQRAQLIIANLKGAKLHEANLQESNLFDANLKGADLEFAKLQRAHFMGVVVDGGTTFLGCKIDENTDLRYTSLENMRIESGTKILLKYNIRRMNWKEWYKKHRVLQWPVKLFWLISDYGISTGRIMTIFFALAIAFSLIYYLRPCCVMVNGVVGDIHGFVHALYFSVVTMTTLGFGDIAANPDSWQGQVVVMVQAILGYVLLGALITRLAVLFTSDGPAGSFTPMGKETKELLAKLEENKDEKNKRHL